MLRLDPGTTAVPVLIVLALVTLTAGWGVTLIQPEVDFVDTVPEHPGLQPYRTLLEELDGVRFLAIYQAHDNQTGTTSLRGDAFDSLVEEQEAFSEQLRNKYPTRFGHELSVQEAMKQGNYMLQKIATGGNPPESAYSMPQDPVTYDQVKQQLLDDDTLDDVLAVGGESALSLFFIADSTDAEARGLVRDVDEWLTAWGNNERNHPVTKDHAPTGLVWASAYTDSINQAEMRSWVPVAALAVALVLFWILRGPANVLVASISLGAALTWTFGLMGFLGVRISFLTIFLAPVVVGIGIDYAVHILHRYDEERGSGKSKQDALRESVQKTGRAVRVAALTTLAALLVMALVPATLFSQIGWVGAIGVFLGFLASVLLAPALRAVLPDRRPRKPTDRIGPALAHVARIPSWVAILVVVLFTVGASVVAGTQTVIESGSQENEFPQTDPTIQLQHRIEAEYGAFQRAYLVVEGDMAKADTLQAMHDAVVHSASIPLWREASAVTSILLANEATDEGAVDIAGTILAGAQGQTPTEQERLPQTDQEAREQLDALFQDPLWRAITPFTINTELDVAVVAISIEPWQNQVQLTELRNALVLQAQELQDALGPAYSVSAAGAPVNRAAIIEQTLPDVLMVTLGTSAVVFVVLAAHWLRKPRGIMVAAGGALLVLVAAVGLLATIPTLNAIYQSAGSGNQASLTEMFLLAFAVTVGIGVDDLVHVAERTWESGSVRGGLRGAGRAISGTSLTTFAAFAAMAGVYFLQSKNLAILTATGVALAYLLTLLMAPPLLRWSLKTRS